MFTLRENLVGSDRDVLDDERAGFVGQHHEPRSHHQHDGTMHGATISRERHRSLHDSRSLHGCSGRSHRADRRNHHRRVFESCSMHQKDFLPSSERPLPGVVGRRSFNGAEANRPRASSAFRGSCTYAELLGRSPSGDSRTVVGRGPPDGFRM